jgi:hypothetical protein
MGVKKAKQNWDNFKLGRNILGDNKKVESLNIGYTVKKCFSRYICIGE